MPGLWGNSRATLLRARQELTGSGVQIVRTSNLYTTKPVGGGRQPRYLNAVVLANTTLAPGTLLRLVKQLERCAGRRPRERMSARPLDIDILDYGGRRVGRSAAARGHGQLNLPHPELENRAFVLEPLLDVEPHWHHPVLRQSARRLLARLDASARAGVRQALDSTAGTCEKWQS
jgi:2-amino-4-hydroxy-6-hydroxymethyldihydropteridine diphosphokinase